MPAPGSHGGSPHPFGEDDSLQHEQEEDSAHLVESAGAKLHQVSLTQCVNPADEVDRCLYPY